jgi:hypothetical protein
VQPSLLDYTQQLAQRISPSVPQHHVVMGKQELMRWHADQDQSRWSQAPVDEVAQESRVVRHVFKHVEQHDHVELALQKGSLEAQP